jgi:hypothetical protein
MIVCCILGSLWNLSLPVEEIEPEEIECRPFSLDRKVVLDMRASKMPPAEVEMKRYFHDLQLTRQVMTNDREAKHFFARNWEPSYSCSVQLRLGCPGDGGKWICDPHIHLQTDNCVVYSFGSNDEFSFETAIYEFNPACKVHTFDPTVPRPTHKPLFLHYHRWGLGTTDAHNKSMGIYFTLPDIMRRLGHDHVNVLKLDCEGCELDFWTLDAPPGAVHQMQVEVHWDGRPQRLHDFFNFLTRKGLAIFQKEPNIQNWQQAMPAVEFALVHPF